MNRCQGKNSYGKKCRTRINPNNNDQLFCCKAHQPFNYEQLKSTCPICCESFNFSKSNVIILKCNHIHHTDCINEWLKYYQDNDMPKSTEFIKYIQCPLCREITKSIKINPNKKRKKYLK